MNTNNIIDMFLEIAEKIKSEKDYITELDSILGDGDHWVNINKGYQKIISMEEELRKLKPYEVFKTVGMTLMSTIGGSSGILYGDSFMKASKVVNEIEDLNLQNGLDFLQAALDAMMNRGKAKPNDKTMIDPLYQAVEAYKKALFNNETKEIIGKEIAEAAEFGMNETKYMIARKGRATYREDKGVGCIDAGAATMCYQLQFVGKYIAR